MSREGARPWRILPGGLAIAVRLIPNGGRDAVDGPEQLADGSTVLKARVRAAPHQGAANAALCLLLAKTLHVPVNRVRIVSGTGARRKTVPVEGDAAIPASALEKLGRAAA